MFLALWKRLCSIETSFLLNDNLKEIIWKMICCNKSFRFYELPAARGELKMYNQFEHLDSIGVYVEMEMVTSIVFLDYFLLENEQFVLQLFLFLGNVG